MYKCIKNTNKTYKSKRGIDISVPKSSEYSVYFKDKLILDVKDHFIDPRNIAEGICRLLNDNINKIKLNLE